MTEYGARMRLKLSVCMAGSMSHLSIYFCLVPWVMHMQHLPLVGPASSTRHPVPEGAITALKRQVVKDGDAVRNDEGCPTGCAKRRKGMQLCHTCLMDAQETHLPYIWCLQAPVAELHFDRASAELGLVAANK